LTWISHMLDAEFYGHRPGGHHFTSLLLHLLNTLFLFRFLARTTKARLRSGVAAALFAIHPLHVESVAWVAERKDVLSTFFLVLILIAYASYVRTLSKQRYASVVLLLVLGLVSKPMLVTVPFLLLLLDYWPLGRFGPVRPTRLIVEKLPLFALTIASSVVTFVVQRSGKAVGSFEHFPLPTRLANALVSYASYVEKTIWPRGLAVFYPYPDSVSAGRLTLAALLLLLVSVGVWRARRRWPYLAVGWLWYLGTLVPVIGLVQVGEQALADRYTYVPLIGLFIASTWGVYDLLRRYSRTGTLRIRWLFALVMTVILGLLMLTARTQVLRWRDSDTLFQHAIAVTEKNHVAHLSLGLARSAQGSLSDAITHFKQAVHFRPDNARAHHNLGVAYYQNGDRARAHEYLLRSVELEPGYAVAHYNLGLSFLHLSQSEEALTCFEEALALDPTHAEAHFQLGTQLFLQNELDEAIRSFWRAVALYPGYGAAHYNLAVALYKTQAYEQAWTELSLAGRLGYPVSPEMTQLIQQQLDKDHEPGLNDP
jgi:tetratricopeptide (TPR) repeat protein